MCTLFIHTLLHRIFVFGVGGVVECAAEARCRHVCSSCYVKLRGIGGVSVDVLSNGMGSVLTVVVTCPCEGCSFRLVRWRQSRGERVRHR